MNFANCISLKNLILFPRGSVFSNNALSLVWKPLPATNTGGCFFRNTEMMGSGKKGTDNAKRVMNRMKEAAKGKKSEASYGKMKKEKKSYK